ncbi:MAG: extracellular solute-binding protein [Proteobacteria bacterium]|nr:extracellular solute-binding protein [Pseudomonadota bacterium]
MKRRTFTRTAILGAAGTVLGGLPLAAQQEKFGSKEMIAAAEKEGGLTYYTANFAEVEQEVIKEFNKTFPKIKVSMVRAPGGQLITRIKTEAAAGKLGADVINHSDRGLMLEIQDLFQDYAPPNAADYRPDAMVSPKLWPGATLGWAIAYNTQLVKTPPKTWKDLLNPEYKGKQIGQVVGPSGGTTWTRIMFERQVLGDDYWAKQAALGIALYPSGAPLSDALVRGEVSIAPLLYNIIYTKIAEGAPAEAIFAPEGVPIVPYADGITKTSKSPNAARLFMNWRLSKEGQLFQITKLGNLTSLKEPPALPKGWDPKVVKVWVPNFEQFEKLREPWMADWNKTYGYRQ